MSQNTFANWDEDGTKFHERLLLSAKTYQPQRLFDVPSSPDWQDGIASPGGNYAYTNRILPAGTSLSPSREGTVEFDGDVVIPTLFDLTVPYPNP